MINYKEIDPMHQLDNYLKTEAGDITLFSSLSLIPPSHSLLLLLSEA